MKLRGKECIEDLIRMVGGQSHAGNADRDQQLTILGLLRLDRKFAFSVHILHGIDAIEREVHEDLLQLDAISHDLGKNCRQLRSDKYVVARCLTTQQDDHLSNNFVYINQPPFRSTLLEEQANPDNDFRRTRSVFHDSNRSRARLLEIWGVARK